MAGEFYDRVAHRFGAYSSPARMIAEYPTEAPERVFERELCGHAGKDKYALDIGAGDGNFTLRMADQFHRVIGIDTSAAMLAVAVRRQQERAIENVAFVIESARQTSFRENTFDILYSRRGPSAFAEYHRVLKPGGHFLFITIGNRDAVELKEVFGRGQNFERRHQSVLEADRASLHACGFEIVYQAEFHYTEYYASFDDFVLFLEGVPIFEDFDPGSDRVFLERYVARCTEAKGIRLPRHRVIEIARKPAGTSIPRSPAS